VIFAARLAIFGLVVRGGVSAILSAFPGPRRPAGPVGLSAVLFHFQKIKFTVGKYDFTSQFLLGQSKAVCESAKSAHSGVIFRFYLRLIGLSQFGLRHESTAALLNWHKPRSV
jgi:hypothetical protein